MVHWTQEERQALLEIARVPENRKIFGSTLKEGQKSGGRKDTKPEACLRAARHIWKDECASLRQADVQHYTQRVSRKVGAMLSAYNTALKANGLEGKEGKMESIEEGVWDHACEEFEYFEEIYEIRNGRLPKMIQRPEPGRTTQPSESSTSHSIMSVVGSHQDDHTHDQTPQVQFLPSNLSPSPEPDAPLPRRNKKGKGIKISKETPEPEIPDSQVSKEFFDQTEVSGPKRPDLSETHDKVHSTSNTENQGVADVECSAGEFSPEEESNQGQIFTSMDVQTMTIDQRLKLAELHLNEKNVLLLEAGAFGYTQETFKCYAEGLKRKYHQLAEIEPNYFAQHMSSSASQEPPVAGPSEKKIRFSMA